MSGRGKRGRPDKGERHAIMCRVPKSHYPTYQRAAAEEGYDSVSDYLAAAMARAHGLPLPAYLERDQEPITGLAA